MRDVGRRRRPAARPAGGAGGRRGRATKKRIRRERARGLGRGVEETAEGTAPPGWGEEEERGSDGVNCRRQGHRLYLARAETADTCLRRYHSRAHGTTLAVVFPFLSLSSSRAFLPPRPAAAKTLCRAPFPPASRAALANHRQVTCICTRACTTTTTRRACCTCACDCTRARARADTNIPMRELA